MFQIKEQMYILNNRERHPFIRLSHRYFKQVLKSDLNQLESVNGSSFIRLHKRL